MDPNDDLRAARQAHPAPRCPGEPLSRAELAELVAADRLAAVIERPRRADAEVTEQLTAVLASQRALEDRVGARGVKPVVRAEVELIDSLAAQARGSARAALIGLAGESRQFLGWMGEDVGDAAAALSDYDKAMDSTHETGDANMVTSVLSMKAHLAWSRRDAGRAIGLAEAGGRDTARVSSP